MYMSDDMQRHVAVVVANRGRTERHTNQPLSADRREKVG